MVEAYDFHVHIFSSWEDESRWVIERAPRTPDYILGSIRNSGMNGIGLIDFEDDRYERFRESVRLPKKGEMNNWKLEKDLGCALVLTSDDYQIKVVKVEELNALHSGHMLIIGLNTGQKIGSGKSLDYVCDMADNFGALKVPSHPGKFLGMSMKKLIETAFSYDAYEVSNSNYDELDSESVGEIFEQTGLRGIKTSDSHNRKDIGNGHIEIHSQLDISSRDNFLGSLRETLRNGNFTGIRRKKNPLASRIGHTFLIIYDYFVLFKAPLRQKLRLPYIR